MNKHLRIEVACSFSNASGYERFVQTCRIQKVGGTGGVEVFLSFFIGGAWTECVFSCSVRRNDERTLQLKNLTTTWTK